MREGVGVRGGEELSHTSSKTFPIQQPLNYKYSLAIFTFKNQVSYIIICTGGLHIAHSNIIK